MATTVTAAHHSIWMHLYDSMHATQKSQIKLKFVTLDKESNISTLWRREEFLRICSKKDVTEKAQDIEVTTHVKKIQETRYNFDPAAFFVNRSSAGHIHRHTYIHIHTYTHAHIHALLARTERLSL